MKHVCYPLIIAFAFVALSCQQNSPPAPNTQSDLIPPVITISGGNSQTQMAPQTPGNGTWTNPSATAYDNFDGDISANIVVTGTVDPNTVGYDTIYYSVSDAAGNSDTDTLIVEITPFSSHVAPYLGGVYNCIDTCDVIGSYNYPSIWTCDTAVNNKVIINNFSAFGTSVNVDAFVNTANQTLSFNVPFSLGAPNCFGVTASGNYTHTGNSVNVVIDFVWTDGDTTETCVGHYNK